tara:strand:+ start:91 stop:756 length:666 start_codon:yes stop_codon:yes gene_type:complete
MPFITYNGRKIWVDNSVSERNHSYYAGMGWKNDAEKKAYDLKRQEQGRIASEKHRQQRIKRQQKAEEKYQAKIIEKHGSMENYINKVRAKDKITVDKINKVKASPKLAKANQNYALTGSKYYKQNMANIDNPDAPYLDSIHCPNCSQRLGNSIDPCPLCSKESRHDHYGSSIYGYMLSHPSDPRWLLPKYNKSKFAPNENSSAEFALNERRKNAGNLDSLR